MILASLDRGGSVVLKDAGVVQWLPCKLHPNIVILYPFLSSHAGKRWEEKVQRASVVQVFNPFPRLPREQRTNSANDMLSIRDQFQEKMLERVTGGLGNFCRRESWEISGRRAPRGGMRGSQPTSLVTLNQVSNLFHL